MTRFIALVPALACIVACSQTPSPEQQAKLAEMQRKIDAQQTQIDSLQTSIGSLSGEVFAQQAVTQAYKRVTLDPASDQGFGRLDTTVMPLTISMKDVKALADGSRLVLSIGNLSTATVSASSLSVKYGSRAPEFKQGDEGYASRYNAWHSGLRERKQDVTDSLRPGTWNTVSINLPGVPPNQLGYVEISGDISQISLRQN